MVGPFMQGMLLMGIIYWYSKGMMSLINDYYRSEFQRKLKIEEIHNTSSLHVHVMDDIDKLIKTENLLRAAEKPTIEVVVKKNKVFEFCENPKSYTKFAHIIEEYIRLSRQRNFLDTNAVCWLNTLQSNVYF